MNNVNNKIKTHRLVVVQIALVYTFATFMAGCGVSPQHISFEQRQERVINDWNKVFAQEDAAPKKMSMEMAMARALKYNLDMKVQQFEAILGQDKLDVSNFAMWPQLLGSLGYLSRSNLNASRSQNLANDNAGTFSYSTSQEKTNRSAGLQFSWNLLDFGVSYIAAKQNADKFLIGLQRNRKIAHNLVRDIRHAYWQAYTAQEIEKDLIPLMEEVKLAIESSQTASEENLTPELDNLSYRRSLYDILRNLTELQKNLIEAKTNLTALTVVPPGTSYELEPTSTEKPPIPKNFPMDLPLLEKISLYDRPELQEADYIDRISLKEIDKTRWQMLPGINLSYGYNYSSNKFLLNRNWAEAGSQLSWNLLKIFSAPANMRAAKTDKDIAALRRMALSVTILTQVDVAYYRYKEAIDELSVNEKLLNVDTNIQSHMIKQYKEGTTDLLTVIRAKGNKILAKLRHNLAYAEWQNAGGQLLTSIGYDLTGDIDTDRPVNKILADVKLALDRVPNIDPLIKKVANTPGFKIEPRKEQKKLAFKPKPEDDLILLMQERQAKELKQAKAVQQTKELRATEAEQQAKETTITEANNVAKITKVASTETMLPTTAQVTIDQPLAKVNSNEKLGQNSSNNFSKGQLKQKADELLIKAKATTSSGMNKVKAELSKAMSSNSTADTTPLASKEKSSYLNSTVKKWHKKETSIDEIISAFDAEEELEAKLNTKSAANTTSSTKSSASTANKLAQNNKSEQINNIKQQLDTFKTSKLGKKNKASSKKDDHLTASAYKYLANSIKQEKTKRTQENLTKAKNKLTSNQVNSNPK